MTYRNSFYATLLCLLICPCALAQDANVQRGQQSNNPSSHQDTSLYRQLVERAKQGDTTVDFIKLRQAYADWINDRANNTGAPDRDVMVEAFKKKNYARAVELAEVVLDYEFVNRGLHLATADAYKHLGNSARADFHATIAQKLWRALFSSGDGRTAETAYKVLSINEEYQVMRHLGYKVHSQSLMTALAYPGSSNIKAYDVLEGEDSSGKPVKVYFELTAGL